MDIFMVSSQKHDTKFIQEPWPNAFSVNMLVTFLHGTLGVIVRV